MRQSHLRGVLSGWLLEASNTPIIPGQRTPFHLNAGKLGDFVGGSRLSNDELAFYDAVSQNESALTEMGTNILASIARDLVRTLRRDVTTDWVSRDDVRAKIRSTIKRLLAKYGYPPDGRDDATTLVLRQMETFADEWSPDAAV